MRASLSRATLLSSPTNKFAGPSAAVWLLNSNAVREEDMAFFAQRLGASEAQRYACFTRRERQRQFLLGRMLVRFAVGNLTAVPADDIEVVERPGYAPRIVLPYAQQLAPSSSISHSRDWVACAVSLEATLGIDIEVNDPGRDIVGLSQLAFQQDEQLWLSRQPDTARLPAFYQLWSTREALYKLMSSLGRGPTLSLLNGMNGELAQQDCDWHCYAATHSNLTIVVCTDRALSDLRQVELTGHTLADGLAANRELAG